MGAAQHDRERIWIARKLRYAGAVWATARLAGNKSHIAGLQLFERIDALRNGK